jgi:tRNA-Thr(GGU) m(6)t(6)A37 methyltransferase TsaA
MTKSVRYSIRPIGFIRSNLKSRDRAPRQGSEGAPDAWLEVKPSFAEGLRDVVVGQQIMLITWLHKAHRKTLKVHPPGEINSPLSGVFATRSPDRPNPLGLHRVTVREMVGNRLRIEPIEAIDGTPVADIKPVLTGSTDS